MSGVILTFAWPTDTSLNARIHWSKRSDLNNANYLDGKASARFARLTMPPGDYHVTFIFHPPDRQRRDLDNFIARMKKHQDGIFSAWGLDDSRIKRVTGEWGEIEKPGRVVVIVETMDA